MSRRVSIIDEATGRAVAVVVLLIAVTAALRGYIPGVDHPDRQPRSHTGASLACVAALLGLSLVIIAVAFVSRIRDPRQAQAASAPLSYRLSGGRGRPSWRMLAIGATVLAGWVLLQWLLSRYASLHQVEPSPSAPQSAGPAPAGNPPQPPVAHDAGSDRDVLRYLVASTVTLAVMIVGGAVVARRRRAGEPRFVAPESPGESTPGPATVTSLVRAAESGLAEVEDANHEPRQAIIACYAAMERELHRLPGAVPQDFDTPTEVLARAVQHHAINLDNATELVSLFDEARFSSHVMTEAHRGRAIDVLRLVQADMRSPI